MLKRVSQLAEDARKEIPEIQAADVAKDLKSGKLPYLLIDVREPAEHATGIIPGSVCMPRGVLELHIGKEVDEENAPIVCYCGGGTRSLFAAQQLRRMGYTNVRSMAGGFKAWTASGGKVAQPS